MTIPADRPTPARHQLMAQLASWTEELTLHLPDAAEGFRRLAATLSAGDRLTLWANAGARRATKSMLDILETHIDALPVFQEALVHLGLPPGLSPLLSARLEKLSEKASRGDATGTPGFAYWQLSNRLRDHLRHFEQCTPVASAIEEGNSCDCQDQSFVIEPAQYLALLLLALARLDSNCRQAMLRPLSLGTADIGTCTVCYRQVYRPGATTCLEHSHNQDAPGRAKYEAARRRMQKLVATRPLWSGDFPMTRQWLLRPFLLDPTQNAGANMAAPWPIWIASFSAAVSTEMPLVAQRLGSLAEIPDVKSFALALKRLDDGMDWRKLLAEWRRHQPEGIACAALITRMLTWAERWWQLEASVLPRIDDSTLLSLMKTGASIASIAQHLGVTRQAVQQAARRLGIPPRTPGRPQRKTQASVQAPVAAGKQGR